MSALPLAPGAHSCKAPAVRMAIVEVVVTLKGRDVPNAA
jgi:hypothetical protein